MTYENLLLEKSGQTMTVTLNRPKKLNALSPEVLQEYLRLFAELREDTETKFVIFTGAGRAFSAGADLTQGDRTREGLREYKARIAQLQGHDFIRNLENLEQVTIAAVNGYCLGAGLVLAMGCDFRIASSNAIFGVPEANVGIFFTWGSTPRLVSLIGPTEAKDMIMTCDMVDAERAFRIGLVSEIVTPEELMNACHAKIAKIASKAPLAVRMTKKLVNAAAAPNFGDLYLCEPELVERIYMSPDTAEGMEAFAQKRAPKFTGS